MSRASLALLVLVLTTGCWEQYAPEWFAQMKQQPAIQALEAAPRLPPEGTVPIQGYVVRIGPENPLFVTPMFAPEATALVNPVLASEESIVRGKAVYTIHCQVCHGADGLANPAENPVTKRMTESGAPPFPLSTTVAYTDGMIFTKIRYGKPLMPGYPQISPEDRWHVVNYLRVLFKVP